MNEKKWMNEKNEFEIEFMNEWEKSINEKRLINEKK